MAANAMQNRVRARSRATTRSPYRSTEFMIAEAAASTRTAFACASAIQNDKNKIQGE
jgi:translation initiation factor 1 (eIF-1/SUI1)